MFSVLPIPGCIASGLPVHDWAGVLPLGAPVSRYAMLLVALAWIYIVVLMAVVEATSPSGTLLGAFFTLLLYGALPLSIVLYLLGTPARRARRASEAAAIWIRLR